MKDKIIYYGYTKSGFILFNYNGITQRYMGYTFKESLKKFKELCNIEYKHVKLVKDNEPITYGFMFD